MSVIHSNRQPAAYTCTHLNEKCVYFAIQFFFHTHKASTHTCTSAFTHIGLLFVVGAVAAVVVAVDFVVVDAVFAVDELSSICCASYHTHTHTEKRRNMKKKWKKDRTNELKMMVSLAAFFAFKPRHIALPLNQLDTHFVAVSMRWCCNGKVNQLCT